MLASWSKEKDKNNCIRAREHGRKADMVSRTRKAENARFVYEY